MQATRDIRGSRIKRGLILSAVLLILLTAGLLVWLKFFPLNKNKDHNGTILVQAQRMTGGMEQ